MIEGSQPKFCQTDVSHSAFTHGSLFSGIGGFDLASSWLGWTNVFQVEKDEWCLSKLAKNFPNTNRYKDIIEFNGKEYKNKITVLSGGFPCQPFSVAGKGKGRNDERYLWGEMFRVITEIEPLYIVAENVPGLATNENGLAFKQVLIDLESKNYKVQTFDIPASSKNANHKRNRLWFVAHANDCTTKHTVQARGQMPTSTLCDATNTTSQIECTHFGEQKERQIQKFGNDIEQSFITNTRSINSNEMELQHREAKWQEYRIIKQKWNVHWSEWGIEPTIRGGNDGLPNRVDRIKALGNAVVPQVVYEIFKCIELSHLHCG
jgi:DNA (cytosine-5)-methyltransferase 1